MGMWVSSNFEHPSLKDCQGVLMGVVVLYSVRKRFVNWVASSFNAGTLTFFHNIF